MRIMDVQEFISTQYKANQKRRVSQHTKFLDRNVHFFTYFNINKILTTTSIANHSVDAYFGDKSPVRYNKINNFPLYGFPLFTNENGYDEENAGLTADYNGEVVMLPGLIEPSEGDCFILDMYDPNRFFVVTEVRQVALKGKSHYALSFTNGTPENLFKLKKQVVDEYNAIFDNIGTEDRVVISNTEYKMKEHYEAIYKTILEYYYYKFFNKRKTMFIISTPITGMYDTQTSYSINYCDVYCTKFMKDNRIIVLDKLLKSSLMLDYNIPETRDIFFKYRETLYNAVSERSLKNIRGSNTILSKKLKTPFSLSISQDSDDVFITDSYSGAKMGIRATDEVTGSIGFDFFDIIDRIEKNKIFISENERDKIISLIVRYFNGDTTINPGYFANIDLDSVDEMTQYMLLPILLYIIRDNIYGLTRLNNII